MPLTRKVSKKGSLREKITKILIQILNLGKLPK